jgi:hypothetical protein
VQPGACGTIICRGLGSLKVIYQKIQKQVLLRQDLIDGLPTKIHGCMIMQQENGEDGIVIRVNGKIKVRKDRGIKNLRKIPAYLQDSGQHTRIRRWLRGTTILPAKEFLLNLHRDLIQPPLGPVCPVLMVPDLCLKLSYPAFSGSKSSR